MTISLAVVAGQSNALGFQVISNDWSSVYTLTSQVQIWADTDSDGNGDSWVDMHPGVNTGTPSNPTSWGPEVSYASAWLQQHPNTNDVLWIVKSVKGSTALAQNAQLDWSNSSSNELFDQTTAKIAAAKAAFVGPVDTTVLWFQGETDAADPIYANAYTANLSALQSAAASDWGADRFLVARIDTEYSSNAIVQSAQQDGFNTDEFGKQADELHLDASGQIDSGYSFYALFNSTALTVPSGTSGNDRYVGSTEADNVSAMDGDDAFYGGPGSDWVHGNAGNDTLYGGSGDDTVYGGRHDDKISADDGNDWVSGDLGNDTIAGGWGDDTLVGGSGMDLFKFGPSSGRDVISDFDGSAGDRLQLGAEATYTLSETAGSTVLTFSGGAVTLFGVPLADFETSWIV